MYMHFRCYTVDKIHACKNSILNQAMDMKAPLYLHASCQRWGSLLGRAIPPIQI